MHQVEKIQSYFRLNPKKPEIQEVYVPFPDYDEYILIFNDENLQSHKYDYFPDVVDLLKESNPNLNFIQVSNVNNPDCISGAYIVKDISHNQLFFLIKNAKLVLCTDTFSPEVCGIYDKPMVCLSGNRPSVNANPYFYNPKKHISICPVDQPSFTSIEHSKAINKIMPEDVCDSIFKIVKLKSNKTKIKTEFIGERYRDYTVDYIPDFEFNHLNNVNHPVNARLDIVNNIDNLVKSFGFCEIQSIFCNSEFDIKSLIHARDYIKSVVFEVNLESSLDFVRDLKELGCNVKLHTKDSENLKDIRLKFIDWNVDLTKPKSKKIELEDSKRYYYKSTKLTLSENKKYISLSAKNNDIKDNSVIDCQEFWDESDHFMIYSVDK